VTSQKLVSTLGVADDARGAIHQAGLHQRPYGEVGRRGVAAGIRHQPRASDGGAAILGQPVDGLGEQSRLRVGFLVPRLVALGRAQAEGAAQIDHADAGVQKGRREFHRHIGGSGQEDQRYAAILSGLRCAWQGRRSGGASDGVRGFAIFAVLQQDWPRVRMAAQDRQQLGAAVAAMSDNADRGVHGWLRVVEYSLLCINIP
jgi:hypothetical protein